MKSDLNVFKVNTRVKLSALWTAVMLLYIYGDYFELYIPRKVEGLIIGQNMLDNPYKLMTAAFILSVPATMIFLSLVLNAKLTKWMNIGVGLFFTVFTFLVGISTISEWRMFYLFYSILESLFTSLVIWYAWNWQKTTLK